LKHTHNTWGSKGAIIAPLREKDIDKIKDTSSLKGDNPP